MRTEQAFKKIDLKIYLVFLVVIAIAFFNAVFSSYTILQSQKTTEEIVNNMNPSMEALSQLNLLVTKSRMLTTNWVYVPPNSSDKEGIINLNKNDYLPLKYRLRSLMKKWNNKSMISNVDQVLADYEKLTLQQDKIMNQLHTFDDYQDPMKKFAAEEVLESQIIPHSNSIDSRLKLIIEQQTKSAKEKQDQMLYQLDTLMAVVFFIAILIVGSLLFAAFVISRTFIVPVMRVREIILDMSSGLLPEYKMRIPKNAVGEMLGALKLLTDSTKRTSHFAEEIGKGNLDASFDPLSEDDIHGHALLTMRERIKEATEAEAKRAWVNEGLARLNSIMRSASDDFNKLLDNIVLLVAEYLGMQQAAIFLLNEDNKSESHINIGAHYALNNKILNSKSFELKEGLIGQSIASNIVIDIEDIDDPFFNIEMGLAQSKSCHLMIIPLATSGKVLGAMVVSSLHKMSVKQKELMEKIAEPVAASLFNVRANLITTKLLVESRQQADELAAQEHELRTINHQLTQKSMELAQSEEELRDQQEELKQVNSILKEKARLLEEKNIAIEDARQSIFFKAEQLEQSNKYKSAFLANMSHELRTPLNSILILAKLLSDNKFNNLSDKQIEHAKVIYKSGSDLLSLINDILDLSKVEAGKLDLQSDVFAVKDLTSDMKELFTEIAIDKQIHFEVTHAINPELKLKTDKIRLAQIVKNLISNALKFTQEGGTVKMNLHQPAKSVIFRNRALLSEKDVLAISVIDSGIGIPKEKQSMVFEAFKQADGSTSRSYGGTGLGLSICRDLAQLIGGEIQLYSREGEGSTFTLYIPYINEPEMQPVIHEDDYHHEDETRPITQPAEKAQMMLRDDRDNIQPNDKKVLIIEDDYVFVQVLINQCHLLGMKAIVSMVGDEGLEFARKYSPHAIILDMMLPIMDGWTILRYLKSDEQLNHIPVHVVTAMEKFNLSMEMGAESFHHKPANSNELHELMSKISNTILNHRHQNILAYGQQSDAMQLLLNVLKKEESSIHFEITNEINGCLHKLKNDNEYCCVIIENSNLIKADEREQINEATNKLNIPLLYLDDKPDECLREVNGLLELKETNPHVPKTTTPQFLKTLKNNSGEAMKEVLKGKTVLIVDDDMRNIYSMTSTLENEGMTVICALNGKDAIEKLKENTGIEIVLMDIMMPVMNGYEATAAIRTDESYTELPIIAVTAKAMSEDREKCIEAGASDYISKPVNTDLLLSVMQAWLYK